MNDFRFRINDIEFKWSDFNLLWELCAWLGESKIVIAFFLRTSEGYDMQTVGNRFFEYDAFDAGRIAMKFLEAEFEFDELIKEVGEK